ncbi:MAG: exopolysaccharide biosynthesis protein [Thermoanaerobaculia bacterium]
MKLSTHSLLAPGDRLEAAIAALPPDGVTLAEIRDLVGQDGLMLLTAFLTIVFLVPVSVPGVSTVFGAGILLIGLSRLFRRDLWIPRRIGARSVGTERLRGALGRGLKAFRKMERFSRPGRATWAILPPLARVINDLGLVVGAVLLMAPFGLIPFSNTLPAIALLLLAVGTLQSDGLCIVFGHLSIVATILYFALLITGGGVAIMVAMERLFG